MRRALVDARLTSYSDKAHMGLARYLQVVVERSSQSAQVVVVANSTHMEPLVPCFELLRERLGPNLHSLWFNSQMDRSNNILGTAFQRWHGPESVVERFGGAAIHYPPGAFGQSNLEIAETIIDHVRSLVPEGARVAEFYAGVGAIGLSMLARIDEIHFNEVGAASLRGLELGLASLDLGARAKVHVTPGTAGAACTAAAHAQVVIADPPRKGLDPELTMFLTANPPERLIYVSCGFESLQRDTAVLTSSGKLRLCKLTAFNLMPFTEHIETVACFERR
jgi:23S rRNA (uracil1939-C5)-methyltransferase